MDGKLAQPAAEGDELFGARILVGEGQHAVLGVEREDRVRLGVGQLPLEIDARHLGAAEHARFLDLYSRLFLDGMDRGRRHGRSPSGRSCGGA